MPCCLEAVEKSVPLASVHQELLLSQLGKGVADNVAQLVSTCGPPGFKTFMYST